MDSIIFAIDGRDKLLDSISEELSNSPEFIGVNDTTSGVIRCEVNTQYFSDGEVCIDFKDSVRGKRVYLLCSPNNSDKIMLLNFAIDAAKRAAAKEIIPIITYMPYARQDKKDQTRGPIGSKVMAEMLENRGATQIITFDLHADQIQGFFNIPVTHMEGKYLFDEQIVDIHQHTNVDVVLCAPDAGAAKRVKHFRDRVLEKYDLDLPIVMIDKTRKEANKVDSMVLIGDVTNKHVIIIDDMIDTGGTLVKGCDELLSMGANSVSAMVTHGIFSGPALGRIYESKFVDFYCSDSLPLETHVKIETTVPSLDGVLKKIIENFKTEKLITQVSTAKQIALAIIAINNDISVEVLKKRK